MGIIKSIKNAFHKLKVGFQRMDGNSLPYVPEEKKYGNSGEYQVNVELQNFLPDAIIFKNVCLNKNTAIGEIDFIVVYNNKVFVIELKRWKGKVFQDGNTIYKAKESYEDTFIKEMHSPFNQINRNTYLIKEQFPNIWFEKALLFLESESVSIEEKCPYFLDVKSLAQYIIIKGRTNRRKDVEYLVNNIIQYDLIYSNNWTTKELNCIILERSLKFNINNIEINKKDIYDIIIKHSFSKDELTIHLKNGCTFNYTLENGIIYYIENNEQYNVSFSKIDYIKIN